MKKFLTVKHCLACVAALFGVLVFVFSFLTALKSYTNTGDLYQKMYNIIWGSKKATVYIPAEVTVELAEGSRIGALALPLIGTFLVLAGGVGACVAAFVCPEKKVLVWVLAALMIVGAVFVALTPLFAFNAMAQKQYEGMKEFYPNITLEQVKEQMKAAGGSLKAPLSIVSAVLAVLGGGAACASSFVKK